MTRVFRYFLLFLMLFLVSGIVLAQESESIRGLHKVKRKETIFAISHMYDLTIEELVQANPEMNDPDYKLKKGKVLRIPYPKKNDDTNGSAGTAGTTNQASSATPDSPTRYTKPSGPMGISSRPIRLGVMLPLHDINGDGKRMVEYYRGVLMACDSLKRMGLSIDVHAWNTAEDSYIYNFLEKKEAQDCDIIIGPLYSKQMEALSNFVERHDIMLVIPFSINAPQLVTNRHIFQIWQSPSEINDQSINRFMERFSNYHPVFIDCNDSTSNKGMFTSGLRRKLEQRNITYSLTNLKSDEDAFSKAFSRTQPNVVILNSARSPELGVAFSKINGLKANFPEVMVTMFGYNEWLMYTHAHLENFYRYNTYIPSVFYYNPLNDDTQLLQKRYYQNFHANMQNSLPRFALTGFDHAYFFLRGLYKYGKTFNGAAGMFGYPPIQTPLMFERYGNGGLRNRAFMLVHYTPDHHIETIRYNK